MPARTGWVGDWIFVKKPNTAYERMEEDGTFKPAGTLRSIQYRVEKEEKERVQVNQEGKSIWIKKDEIVRMKDAVEHYTKMLDEDPNNDIWFAFRGWARALQQIADPAHKATLEKLRARRRKCKGPTLEEFRAQ